MDTLTGGRFCRFSKQQRTAAQKVYMPERGTLNARAAGQEQDARIPVQSGGPLLKIQEFVRLTLTNATKEAERIRNYKRETISRRGKKDSNVALVRHRLCLGSRAFTHISRA